MLYSFNTFGFHKMIPLSKNNQKMKKQLFTIALGFLGLSAFSQSTIWQPYNSNLDTAYYPRFLSVVDTNTVWAIGFSGHGTNPNTNRFTRTIDGANYHAGTFNTDTNTYSPSGISAADANTAFIVTSVKSGATGTGQVLKTTDGGNTWNNVKTTGMYTGALNFPDWVYFWDANNGIVFGDPDGSTGVSNTDMFEIYRTHNGGTSWTRVDSASMPLPLNGDAGLTSSFAHYKKWLWAGTFNGYVFASADSGKTWKYNNTGSIGMAGGVDGLAFRDSLNGLAWGLDASSANILAKTADGGITWTPIVLTASIGVNAISTIPKTKGYMSVGLNGASTGYVTSVTYDDASTWTILESGQANALRMLSVQMVDSLNGWAGSFSDSLLPYGRNGINRFKLGHKKGCPITLTSTSTSTPFNVCKAGTATLTAAGLNTYTWSTSATTASITVTPSVTTSYSVAGTTTVGCANYEVFTITVISPSLTAIPSHTVCEGVNLSLAAGGTDTYSWSPVNGLSADTGAVVIATPSVSTTYTVTGIKDLCHASPITIAVTIKPAPNLSVASNTLTLCTGSTATLTASGASTYAWSTGATTAMITVTPTVTTTYSVVGTGTVNTCTSTYTVTETVNNCVGIEQYSGADNLISIYPNPSNGFVSLSISNVAANTFMTVSNMIGQTVYTSAIKEANTNFDFSSLQKGFYTITILNGESKHVQKIIIQ